MKNYKAYLFDMDLTALNSIDSSIASYIEAFKSVGKVFDEKTVIHHLSQNLMLSYKEIENPSNDYETFLNGYLRVAKDTLPLSNLYKDAYDYFMYLLNNNKKIGIITNRAYYEIEPILKKYNLVDKFETIITSDKITKFKPDPEPVNKALEEMKLESKDCVYFGDSINDYLSSKNANVDFIAVERYDNCKFECDLKIKTFKELIQ